MRIVNITRGTDIASDAVLADGIVSRTVGLLGKKGLPSGGGLVLEPCSSIHTFFMRFPIDVVWAERSGRVLKVVEGLKTYRFSGALRARYAIELPEGAIASSGTQPGDNVEFQGR